ncbi:SLC13 family permease [Psychroflexus sediminis]|uniref:Solute carrier family 13 (Sodium-dependent dicarboxylate transporter), member 2/3/5 n=1 Tax=Psychroflexus sediminis TaxID=470826 RepID=A0A1G7UNL8_9FLAO|nr:DASS family sodium-coupled anion symporter [Psychroflexus sediminis]SDG49077.1 solute carrier family 13 (sodium-dependent dicarboxylate transporter), member 2/3/5 [Psychroflexus sediminis]
MKQFKAFVFKILGPLVFVLFQYIVPPEGLSQSGFMLLGITIWMAIWWVFEVVPIAVTALIPIIVFPLFNVLSISETTAQYGHKYVFLYLGGFVLAVAIERWDLHRRIALHIIKAIGSKASFLILGFMLATAFLSMWISNTATTVMMLPIAIAITNQINEQNQIQDKSTSYFSKALMLSIAYSASIGGIATLIGTPPNLVLAGVLENTYGIKIGFFEWMVFAFPVSMILLLICWKYLTGIAFQLKSTKFSEGKSQIKEMIMKLGKFSYEEKMVGLVFLFAALAWIFRGILEKIIPGLDDTIIAVCAALLLFLIPSKKRKGKMLLTWKEAVRIPWGIIILFGGGMALAKGFTETGLATWIAGRISLFEGLSLIVFILAVATLVNFLTEVTSNLATTAMLLPVLAPVALSFNMHPYFVMIAVTLSASCAFMLPVATPPNAIVFGSNYLKVSDMVKKGFLMNIISIIFITLAVYFFMPYAFGLETLEFPEVLKK